MKLKRLLTLFLILSSTVCFGQTSSGIIGRRHLIGYNANVWSGGSPILVASQLYVERLLDQRHNIGLSFTSKNSSRDLIEPYTSIHHTVTIDSEGQKYYIIGDGMRGTYNFKIQSYEVYIKRFKKKTQIRNFGPFYSFRFGINKVKTSVNSGTEFYVSKDQTTQTKIIKVTDPIENNFSTKYVGFELGRTTPFIGNRTILTFSISTLVNFYKVNYDDVISFEDYTKNEITDGYALSQLLSFNIGLAYTL